MGSGIMNTILAVLTQAGNDASGSFAAKVCTDYSVIENDITYGGWYLPSLYELNLLYLQREVVGGFSEDYYWSSTEDSNDYNNAWVEDFTDGSQYVNSKADGYFVRPIRSF